MEYSEIQSKNKEELLKSSKWIRFIFMALYAVLINFIVLPIFFYLTVYIKKKSKSVYRKKPYKKNLFFFGTAFGFGFYLSGIHWITHSLTFNENFKILIPF